MREVVLGELRHNARRALGAALAIGIAVAFVVVSLGAAASLQDYLRYTSAGSLQAGDLVVEAGDDGQLTDRSVEAVAATPGVAAVYEGRSALVRMAFFDGERDTVATETPPVALRWFDLRSGRAPSARGEVAVDTMTARDARLSIGSTVSGRVRDDQGRAATPVTLTVVGIVPSSALAGQGSRQVLVSGEDLKAWGMSTVTLAITVKARPGADPAALADALRTAVPGAEVRSGAAAADKRAGNAGIILASFLLMFTAVAMIVAVIVISNTFAIVLAQRTEQLALVRCLGGTRRQVYRGVLVEALVVGLTASLAGAAVGLGVLTGGVAAVRASFSEADGLRSVVPPVAVAGAVVVGVLVTLVAAWLPARRATRITPLAALRPDPARQARRTGLVRVGLGLAAIAAGGALLTLLTLGTRAAGEPPDGGRPNGDPATLFAGIGCGLLVVLGVLLSGPVVVPAVARLLGRPLGATGPVGRLAVTSTLRNPQRAAATSVALFVGVCLITLMSVGAATTTTALAADIDKTFPVDVSVTGASPSTPDGPSAASNPLALAGSRPLPAAALSAVSELAGVAATATLRGARVTLDGESMVVMTGDLAELRSVVRTQFALASGTLLAPEMLQPGSTRGTLTGAGGALPVTVVRSTVPVLLVGPADFDRLTSGMAVNPSAALLVRTADGVDASAFSSSVRKALASAGVDAGDDYAAFEGKVSVGGALQLRAATEQALSVMLSIATGLLAVALLISLVGIGNTMALSVLERRREIGVLRALGLTRAQLRRTLTLEAVLLALVGTVLGLVLGTAFGYAGARLLLSGMVDVGGVSVPWDRIAGVVAVALGAAVLAAVLPGRRAGRVAPTEAIAAT